MLASTLGIDFYLMRPGTSASATAKHTLVDHQQHVDHRRGRGRCRWSVDLRSGERGAPILAHSEV